MSIELIHVHRLRVFRELAASFGIEQSASVGSFVDVRFLSAEATLNEEMMRDERLVQRRYTEPLDIIGPRATELALSMHLMPTGSALDAAATPAADPVFSLGIILQTIMGGYTSAAGSTEAGASTTSLINVGGGDGANWDPGRAIGATVAGSIEAREISSIATDAITVKTLLSAAPTASSVVLNAHTFFMADDPDRSLQFLLESAERDDIWWLTGMQGTLAMDLSLRALPTATFALRGPNWFHDDDVTLPLTSGSSLGVATLVDGDPPPFVSSEVIFTDISGTVPFARTPIDLSSITITPNFAYEPLPSPGGVNGVARWVIRPNRPTVTAEFTLPFEVEDLFDDRTSRTRYALFTQINNVAGSTVLISMPNVQITNVQRADSEGIIGQTVSVKALEDEDATDQTTELRRSPFRIHLL